MAYGRNVTVEAYFKLGSPLPIGNTNRWLYEECASNGDLKVGFGVKFTNGIGQLEAAIPFSQEWGVAAANVPVVADRWYYAAATFTGTNGCTPTVYLYDGRTMHVQVGSTAPGSPVGQPANVLIGNAYDDVFGRSFGGVIQNVSVYDTVLDWATILNHATQPPAGKSGEWSTNGLRTGGAIMNGP